MPNSYKKLIDFDLLSYFKSKLDLLFANKVDKVDGKGLSSNDYTSNEKTKLAGIAAGAQVNVIEGVQIAGSSITPTNKIVNIPVATTSADGAMSSGDKTKLNGVATGAQVNVIETIKRNGTALTVAGKAVDISVPTKTSDIQNDSGFITASDVPEGAAASETTPKMNAATAVVGTETTFARGDHVHPSDSTKVDKETGKGLSTNDYTTAEKNKLGGIAAGAQVNVVTDASSTGSGAAQTMSVSKGNTTYTTYTKDALDTSLGLKANASNVYTKTEIDQKLSGAMNYKGTKATTDALPSSGNAQGDVWHVTADGSEWAWNGTTWEELGTAIDLSGYVEDDDLGLATTAQIDDLFT